MEVLDASAAWLSDYEVREHLREQKALRDRISESIGRPVRPAENLLTVEFEILGYFKEHKHTEHFASSCTLQELMTFLKGYTLTKAEKLQLVNLLPQSEVEFYLIVEECEERFTPEQIGQILEYITFIRNGGRQRQQ